MTAQSEIIIRHLLELPGAPAILERWFIEAWGPWYGPGGAGDAKADLAACRSRDAIPICLLALDGDGELLATATLKADSVGGEPGMGPWLAAVLVAEPYQGKGIGTALVKAIEAEAVRMDYSQIYSSTDSAGRILERCGWQACGTTETLRGTATIYRRQLRANDETPIRPGK